MRVFTQVVKNISSAERDNYTLLSRLAVNELVTDLENYLGAEHHYLIVLLAELYQYK
ncbi:MAG: hypothetical protein ACQZ3N_06910 [cyanobacterium endosymbiont of Rhopalodia yunnanensis]